MMVAVGFNPRATIVPPIIPRRGAAHDAVGSKSSQTVNRRSATGNPRYRFPVG